MSMGSGAFASIGLTYEHKLAMCDHSLRLLSDFPQTAFDLLPLVLFLLASWTGPQCPYFLLLLAAYLLHGSYCVSCHACGASTVLVHSATLHTVHSRLVPIAPSEIWGLL